MALMTERERMDALLAKIAALGDWMTGLDFAGPDAEVRFAAETERIVERFPFVKRDAGWFDFLHRYGGATLSGGRDMLSMGLYGVGHDASLHLLDGPGDVVESGCLNFSDVEFARKPGAGYTSDTISLGFGFEATGERRPGVYRVRDGQSHWYCETFVDFLERFAAKEGRLAD